MSTTPLTHKKINIGPYTLRSVPTGIFGLDGGAMFGTVPKVLWEKSIPADEKNRIPMEARGLLLQSTDKNILIDTGNGGHFVEKYGEKLGLKFREMYNIDEEGPSLKKSLATAGLKPEDITHVILTHLHFDHAGGATIANEQGLCPTFPKARYYVQRKNLETAQKPNLRERASYFPSNFQPLLDRGILELLDGDIENLLPNISVLTSHGHTQAQQLVKISDGTDTLLYGGDLIPTSAHIRLAWLMGYDLNPLLLMEEKQKILSQAADQNWSLFFEHDPFCEAATVVRAGSDFGAGEKFLL